MCIAFFEWTEDRFLVCHNRDEFFSRPTISTEWWSSDDDDNGNNEDGFEILAPRDAVSGGTWFGFEKKTGRCAFLTNIRELDSTKYTTSRGEFVVKYLKSDTRLSALEYLRAEFGGDGDGDGTNDCGTTKASPSEEATSAVAAPSRYGGFNLVVFSGHDLAYFSNRYPDDQVEKGPIALSMGTPYGLSNSVLQEPYAKVRKGLGIFEQVLAGTRRQDVDVDDYDHRLMDGLQRLMQRKEYCPGDPLPRTGEPGFLESVVRHRSSICVPEADGYGTRTTIRFVLERCAGDDDGEDGKTIATEVDGPGEGHSAETTRRRRRRRRQRRLRCVEKNWNPGTLDWDVSTDLNCIVSVR